MRIHKRKLTLQDVADACGVSPTAVSLVLNDKATNISQATKDRIIKAAKEMNYQFNGVARSLAMQKTHIIGVIIPDISNAFFSESIRNIQIELNKRGYEVILCNSEDKHKNDLKYLKLLLSRQVDGIIMTISSESMIDNNWEVIKKILIENETPHVLYDRYYPGNDAKVFVDNQKSAYELTKYLIDKGHRQIGLITGPMTLNSSKGRYVGAKKAMADAKIKLNKNLVYSGKYDIETGRKGAKMLLGKVSAIFAFNDLQAYGVIEEACASNIKIPDDISLIGFDDIFYSSILETKLTTVKQPIAEMSKATCDLLLDIIEDPSRKAEISLPGHFIIRDSVRSKE
ncbi:MAG: LacI family DNA-binding transcriptional regulator [Bacilli bacterium]|jgi:LacI family transcriptional regulator